MVMETFGCSGKSAKFFWCVNSSINVNSASGRLKDNLIYAHQHKHHGIPKKAGAGTDMIADPECHKGDDSCRGRRVVSDVRGIPVTLREATEDRIDSH